jgi:hypothetical protein
MDTIAQVVQAFAALHFQYAKQILAALPPMIVTVILHGLGMRLAAVCYQRFGLRPGHRKKSGPHVVLLISIVAIMLVTHYLEVIVWAIVYFQAQMLPDIQTAMFFSINSYTTLGASNLTLPGQWKGLDGFEAITGMLMFGWSTAVLAAIVMESHSIDE